MAIITYFGKTLIVVSILFQAFLLYQDPKETSEFQANLNAATADCSCLQSVKSYLQQYLRLAVVGLLGTSALTLVLSWSSFKITTIFGLLTLLWVQHHRVFCTVPSLSLLDNAPFWHSLGVIGAVLYLAAAECTSCNKKAGTKEEKKKDETPASKDKDSKKKR